MKHISIGLAGLLSFIALLGFWRVHGLSQRDLDVLTPEVDKLARGWEAKRVPSRFRVINFIISDADSGPDPFVEPEEPGLWNRAMAWFGRSIVGGNPAAEEPTAFAKSFADDPTAVVWTHEGFSTVSEEAMTREIAKAIIRAHDAGAEVNIVAQGGSAAPVLLAMKSLEGTERGGVKVGANKIVLVGMTWARLKRIPSLKAYDFSNLGNVIELANIWIPQDLFVESVTMQLRSRTRNGTEISLAGLWLELAREGRTIPDVIRIVRQFIGKVESIEGIMVQKEQAQKQETAKKAADEAAEVAVKAKKAAGESARKAAEARKALEETARKETEARVAAEAAVTRAEAAQKAAEAAGAIPPTEAPPAGEMDQGTKPQAAQGNPATNPTKTSVWRPAVKFQKVPSLFGQNKTFIQGAQYNPGGPGVNPAGPMQPQGSAKEDGREPNEGSPEQTEPSGKGKKKCGGEVEYQGVCVNAAAFAIYGDKIFESPFYTGKKTIFTDNFNNVGGEIKTIESTTTK